jgi:preprotein translocase subunit SecE
MIRRVARDRQVPRRCLFGRRVWCPVAKCQFAKRLSPRLSSLLPGNPRARMVNPLEFLQQVRSEGSKVTWPSRRETLITTAMVLLMVVLASAFFVAVDEALRFIVSTILGFGR